MITQIISAMNSMSNSDWISLAALLVAIMFGLLNFIYTRRTFEASTYPLLRISLFHSENTVGRHVNVYPNYETRLSITLTNPSKDISITDVAVLIKARNPAYRWRFWKRKWFTYDEINIPYIETFSSEPIQTKGSIEKFLEEKCPKVVLKVKPEGEDEASEYYSLNHFQPVRLSIKAKYKPNISNARFVVVRRKFTLTPSPHPIDMQHPMIKWELTPPSKKLPTIG